MSGNQHFPPIFLPFHYHNIICKALRLTRLYKYVFRESIPFLHFTIFISLINLEGEMSDIIYLRQVNGHASLCVCMALHGWAGLMADGAKEMSIISKLY